MQKLIILFWCVGIYVSQHAKAEKPSVFIFTDINIDAGDPDDRQSLIHLLWYSDQLDIKGIVPDRWEAGGYKACTLALDAYARDYKQYSFKTKGFPLPRKLQQTIVRDSSDAVKKFIKAAKNNQPLYVLVWGNMSLISQILVQNPKLSHNIRLVTIGTGLLLERDRQYLAEKQKLAHPCQQPNWNGKGRNLLFSDARFNDLWWLEINWTYNGMFTGKEPETLFDTLKTYGEMGKHIATVVKNHPWAQYFRVGDTPSVLYLIDPAHKPDQPTESSWAGSFRQPFPEKRPYYFTDDAGTIEWNYEHPCKTWENHEEVFDYAKSTLENKRKEMYSELVKKLNSLYHQ